jgi:murein DD-endopeptidase MepM/ murein hydrolase activator NlpD
VAGCLAGALVLGLLAAVASGALTQAGQDGQVSLADIAAAGARPSESLSPSPDPTWELFLDTVAPSPSPRPTPTPSPSPSPRPTKAPVPLVVGGYTMPIRGCNYQYSNYHRFYQATDFYVAKGCAFVATTTGTVDEVRYVDTFVIPTSGYGDGATRGGIFVSIVGDDGVRYYGGHLSAIAPGIAPGVRVTVGQLLGRTGQTGDARRSVAHLHFGISWPTENGIWWVRRGIIYPWPYLDSWRAGVVKSPVAAIEAAHLKQGDIPPCTAVC